MFMKCICKVNSISRKIESKVNKSNLQLTKTNVNFVVNSRWERKRIFKRQNTINLSSNDNEEKVITVLKKEYLIFNENPPYL